MKRDDVLENLEQERLEFTIAYDGNLLRQLLRWMPHIAPAKMICDPSRQDSRPPDLVCETAGAGARIVEDGQDRLQDVDGRDVRGGDAEVVRAWWRNARASRTLHWSPGTVVTTLVSA